MHAFLISMGTSGDVFPFIGLGRELRARGHDVTLVSNERYERFAKAYDFQFIQLVSEEDTRRLLDNPDLWHPTKSALVGARWARAKLHERYELVRAAAQTPDAVLVAYPPLFAARIVQELHNVPLASLLPMPWMIPSAVKPPTLAGITNLPNRLPRPFRTVYWHALEQLTDWLIGRDVNRLRTSLGLAKVRHVARWAYSPTLTIAMFPDWFATAQSDWPTNTQTVGFSMYDGLPQDSSWEQVQAFCEAGAPPIAFTFGSGMLHAADLFQKAVDVCNTLESRGILISTDAAQIPQNLPDHIKHCSFAPFHRLLPHCAALVHHGGLGTTAQALATGTPQLITPFAWDQYDNAKRVTDLGVGNWCTPTASGARWQQLLAPLLTPAIRDVCRSLASRLENNHANTQAADLLEDLARH